MIDIPIGKALMWKKKKALHPVASALLTTSIACFSVAVMIALTKRT
jgi:hypothetical protein